MWVSAFRGFGPHLGLAAESAFDRARSCLRYLACFRSLHSGLRLLLAISLRWPVVHHGGSQAGRPGHEAIDCDGTPQEHLLEL